MVPPKSMPKPYFIRVTSLFSFHRSVYHSNRKNAIICKRKSPMRLHDVIKGDSNRISGSSPPGSYHVNSMTEGLSLRQKSIYDSMIVSSLQNLNLAASGRGQCVTDCDVQIRSSGPLDRSLSSARRMEFDKAPHQSLPCVKGGGTAKP